MSDASDNGAPGDGESPMSTGGLRTLYDIMGYGNEGPPVPPRDPSPPSSPSLSWIIAPGGPLYISPSIHPASPSHGVVTSSSNIETAALDLEPELMELSPASDTLGPAVESSNQFRDDHPTEIDHVSTGLPSDPSSMEMTTAAPSAMPASILDHGINLSNIPGIIRRAHNIIPPTACEERNATPNSSMALSFVQAAHLTAMRADPHVLALEGITTMSNVETAATDIYKSITDDLRELHGVGDESGAVKCDRDQLQAELDNLMEEQSGLT